MKTLYAVLLLLGITGAVLLEGWVLGWFGPSPLAITPVSVTAIEYDGKLDAEWITVTDNKYYSDYNNYADFVETKTDKEITGNLTLINFTSNGQNRQFAMKLIVDRGPVKDVNIEFKTANSFAENNLTILSLDIKKYDPDDNLREYSLNIKDNEVDERIGSLAEGDYVVLGVIHSLRISNSSVGTLYNGVIKAKNPDANDEVNTVNFDILGGALVE